MADFRTHVTVSGALGAGYTVIGSAMGFPLDTALVGGGLCGVAGMLPDVDSDSGVPRRESLGFAAAIVPMLMMDRWKQIGLGHDQMVVLAVAMYVFIRFVLSELIGKWSVHRGMWHSLPAVAIFAGLAFLISGSPDIMVRYFKGAAVGLGALSHLVLDEVYSINTSGLVPRLKKSFGTAVKLWGPEPWANFSCYVKLALVAGAIAIEPSFIERVELRNPQLAERLRETRGKLDGFEQRFGLDGQGAPQPPAGGFAPSPLVTPYAQQGPAQPGAFTQQGAWQPPAPLRQLPPQQAWAPPPPYPAPAFQGPPSGPPAGFAPNSAVPAASVGYPTPPPGYFAR
ncbi:MAG: metal-dependent hydrolase [Lacipirellulaceae bacterium]